MIKVSDFIANYLANSEAVAHDVFLVSGGGMMHLLDSVGRSSLHYICNHHEQACTMAAEAYARVTNKIGVAFVTTGPGGTNAITGVMGAWVDSIPMLVISGQVKISTTIINQPKLRQLGDQEINIIDLIAPITKYSTMITDKNKIKYHLQKAIYLAKSGRPGPVWIDVPLDIQAALVEEDALFNFDPVEKVELFDGKKVNMQVEVLADKISKCERPVFIIGNGIRLSESQAEFLKIAENLNIPILTAISGVDLVSSDHPLFFGRPGILGARSANFIMQNSDLLIIIGTRMSIRITGYSFDYVAREAYKVMVDIDKEELNKTTFRPDLKIHSDVRYFLKQLNGQQNKEHKNFSDRKEWMIYCQRLRKKYPIVTEKHAAVRNYVSSYYFPKILSSYLPENAVVVTGNGTAYTSTFQAMPIKKGQRLFANVGCAAMGYDLPAAIGACLGNKCNNVVCITGDGSIQMNLQELQTIVHNKLPIKIFVYNNAGYLSIKNTQENFFNGFYTGSEESSGVTIPDMLKVAQAYGLPTERISNHEELEGKIQKVLYTKGPFFCEIVTDPHEQLGPKALSVKKTDGIMVSGPLEDLYPFLPRNVFNENMIVKPVNHD